MNVFYEEDGDFKAGSILADQAASLHVESPHGKRSKIKAANALLRFDSPAAGEFLAQAQAAALAIDVDFLWQCCGADEFNFDVLARDYYGHAANALESAALLFRLHGAPMYFYKRGKGRYKAAPEASLKAALASVEKKRLQAEQKDTWVAELIAGRLPAAFEPLKQTLLYKPDKNTLEWKALEAACDSLKLTPARLFEHCGALGSPYDYHLGRFLFDYFPRGIAFADGIADAVAAPPELPLADVAAFSIDDATTTEIDDALSVTPLPDGGVRVGIHIAAPALGIPRDSPLDAAARERLSTVYFPGDKVTMLPATAVAAYTLAAGAPRPALSCYIDFDADLKRGPARTVVERVPIAANLSLDALAPVFTTAAIAAGRVEHPQGEALLTLHRIAVSLQAARGKTQLFERVEYSFSVEDGRVRIVPRERGSPLDTVVAEMMILVNATWGGALAEAGLTAIYRNQGAGGVRMSTAPGAHEGLGVKTYLWASSPLRRYVDLVNQRQLIAMAGNQPPSYGVNDEGLLAAMRDFEVTYEAYGEFQDRMERYWCLRWLEQEAAWVQPATVVRENIIRFNGLPMTARVSALPPTPPGTSVTVRVEAIDLLDLTFDVVPEGAVAVSASS
jgi:exoribonuclease-2